MMHQPIPQRKTSSNAKHDNQKQYFSNTNVLTGISQTAITNSYRSKQPPSAKDYSKVSSSEKLKKQSQNCTYVGGYDIVADLPLSPNTKVTNCNQSNSNNTSNFLNQTAPIKFSSNSKQSHPGFSDQHGENSGYHSAIASEQSSKQHLNTTASSQQYSSTRATSNGKHYSQHPQQSHPKQNLNTPKANYSSNNQQSSSSNTISKQGSNNNLRNKYNRYPVGQQATVSPQVQSSSQGRTSNPQKSSSTLNLLNKTQVITTQILTQPNNQYKQQHHQNQNYQYQRCESIGKDVGKSQTSIPTTGTASRNQSAKAQPQSLCKSSNANEAITQQQQQVIQQHKTTLNEYKQFMDKQKQMLKQLSSNKLAVMLNALNTSPRQIQQQIQSKKPSNTGSKVHSPKMSSKPSAKVVIPVRESETYKENISQVISNITAGLAQHKPQQQQARTDHSTTPRSQPVTKQIDLPIEKPQVRQQDLNQTGTTGNTTPRQSMPLTQTKPVATSNECDNKTAEAQQQPQTEPNQEQNPNDDSMCFSKKSSLEDYIIGKQIGQGAYAVVRIGLHKPSNKKVAMKIYKKYKLLDSNRRKSVKREIKLMEKMKHPHIIRLYEVIDTSKYVILVMEYVGGGSLHGYLKSKPSRRLDEDDAKRLFKQVLEGIKYCHSRCITHRDIKLENLLLDENNNIKIIDFGFSTCIPNEKKIKIFCGTPSYMAPEIVQKTEYAGPPADIWALGVLLFTILSGCFPYRGATDKELYKKIMGAEYRLPSEVKSGLSLEAVNLIKRLFCIDANKRISAKEVLHDQWLTGEADIYQVSAEPQIIKQPARSNSIQPSSSQTTQKQEQYKRSNTDVQNEQRNPQYQKVDTQQAAQYAYFGNVQHNQQHTTQQQNSSTPSHQHQKDQHFNYAPYADTQGSSQIPQSLIAQTLSSSARQSFVNSNPCSQNIMAGGNTINNNFNIVNSQRDHILIILKGDNSQREPAHSNNINSFLSEANQKDHQGKNFTQDFDESIVQSIVNKLGYTSEEVRKYIKEENSFVSILYQKIAEEQSYNKNRQQKSCFSAKSGVQPSVVPSISSSINQSNNISFNNTQPIPFGHLDRSRGDNHNDNYYGGSYSDTAGLSQTMIGGQFMNSSILSGLGGRKDHPSQQRNRDHSLGLQNQTQFDMLSSNEDDHSVRNSMIGGQQMLNSSMGNVHYNLNNTQGNLTAMLSNSSFNDQNFVPGNDNSFTMHGGLNNTQPLNLSGQNLYSNSSNSHLKKQSFGGAAAELQSMLVNQGIRRSNITVQQHQQQQQVPQNKNLQWRREFL